MVVQILFNRLLLNLKDSYYFKQTDSKFSLFFKLELKLFFTLTRHVEKYLKGEKIPSAEINFFFLSLQDPTSAETHPQTRSLAKTLANSLIETGKSSPNARAKRSQHLIVIHKSPSDKNGTG